MFSNNILIVIYFYLGTGFGAINDTSFSVLRKKVCENTLKAIKDMGFMNMIETQAKAILSLLEKIWLALPKRSDKILAFLIPTVELIYKLKFMPCNGKVTICIVSVRKPFQYFLFHE